jgi:hypothetical protein
VKQFPIVQETNAMKNLFALVVLVTALAVTGCKGEKKPDATPAPPVNSEGEKAADPAAAPAE